MPSSQLNFTQIMFWAIYVTFHLIFIKNVSYLNVFSFKYLSLAPIQFGLFSTLKPSSIHELDSSRTNFQYHAKIIKTNALLVFPVITTNTYFLLPDIKKITEFNITPVMTHIPMQLHINHSRQTINQCNVTTILHSSSSSLSLRNPQKTSTHLWMF